MRSVSAALQAIIDADAHRPVATVDIVLNDGTALYVADRAVTIGGNTYSPDLMAPPRLVVAEGTGIDHTTIEINNGDRVYSTYNNSDLFDGATVALSQYFATSAAYTSFEGPVVALSGVVSSPVSSGKHVIGLTVLANARLEGGRIGRSIKRTQCLNTFRDANCGYTHSASIASGSGTTWTLAETRGTAQFTLPGPLTWRGFPPGPVGVRSRVMIVRDSSPPDPATWTVIDGGDDADQLHIVGPVSPDSTVVFNRSATALAGDFIVYPQCPKTLDACLARWQIGAATPQHYAFEGFGYTGYDSDGETAVAGVLDTAGSIIPLMYGERWIKPVFVMAHLKGKNGDEAWNSTISGPFVYGLISEGPVEEGIAVGDPADWREYVEFGGRLGSEYGTPFSPTQSEELTVHLGTDPQTHSDFAPKHWGFAVAGAPRLDHIAHFVIDLPDAYDMAPSGGLFSPPDLRVKAKGRNMPVGGYSKDPLWQAYDVLTAPIRTAASDAFSALMDTADLDTASFTAWAAYADELITAYDHDDVAVSVPRFESSIYWTSTDRAALLRALLQAARATPIFKDGAIGVVVDAPTGGKGTVTGATALTMTDSKRTDTAYPAIPPWPANRLVGLKVEYLTGANAGEIVEITANTADSITVGSAWTVTPSAADEYAIYAVALSQSNSGNVSLSKVRPSHELTNEVEVRFEADSQRGVPMTVVVADDMVDGNGDTHIDRFGPNRTVLELPSTTSYQQAVRHGWYYLRRGLDENWRFVISDVNIEGIALEVGDLALLSHEIDGFDNEIVRVERIESEGTRYKITARLYREHVRVDWPTSSITKIGISQNLPSPTAIPNNVTGLVLAGTLETNDDMPLVTATYTLPGWPYSGWVVLIEGRRLRSDDTYSDWELLATSRTATASFRAPRVAVYEVRVVFLSQAEVRADAAWITGTATSGQADGLTDTGKNWEDDVWAGYYVRIVAGTGAGDEPVLLTGNTSTKLEVSSWPETQPDNTSVYEVFLFPPSDALDLVSGVDCSPVMDEDDGDFAVWPYRTFFANAVKILTSTDGTVYTQQNVIDTGTVSTADEIPVASNVSVDGTVVVSYLVGTEESDGTGQQGPLRIARATYKEGDQGPKVTWRKKIPEPPNVSNEESVEFVVTDDSDQVAFWVQEYEESVGSQAAWVAASHRHTDADGVPDATGYASDPLIYPFEITRPAEGANRRIVVYRGEDGGGQFSKELKLTIDGNKEPSGKYIVPVLDVGEVPFFVPDSDDPDAGSWRARIKEVTRGDDATFDAVTWVDGANEVAGSTMDEPYVMTGKALTATNQYNIEGYFFSTTSILAGTQQGSGRSQLQRAIVRAQIDTINPVVTAKLVMDKANNRAKVVLTVVSDPQSRMTATSFHHIAAPDADFATAPLDDPATWDGYDNTAPYETDSAVAVGSWAMLLAKHDMVLAWAYQTADGWVTGLYNADRDEIPEVVNLTAALVSPQGDAEGNLRGDDDLNSFHWKAALDSIPAEPAGSPDGTWTAVDGITVGDPYNWALGTVRASGGHYVGVTVIPWSGATAGAGNRGDAVSAQTGVLPLPGGDAPKFENLGVSVNEDTGATTLFYTGSYSPVLDDVTYKVSTAAYPDHTTQSVAGWTERTGPQSGSQTASPGFLADGQKLYVTLIGLGATKMVTQQASGNNWLTDQWVNYWALYGDGAVRRITANTADALTVDGSAGTGLPDIYPGVLAHAESEVWRQPDTPVTTDPPNTAKITSIRWVQNTATTHKLKYTVQVGPDVLNLYTWYSHPTTGTKTAGKTWSLAEMVAASQEFDLTAKNAAGSDLTWTVTVDAPGLAQVWVKPHDGTAYGDEVTAVIEEPKDVAGFGVRTKDAASTERYAAQLAFDGTRSGLDVSSTGAVTAVPADLVVRSSTEPTGWGASDTGRLWFDPDA